MGASASKSSKSSPEYYIEEARKVQELPNKILHILFSQTDFKDILALSSIDACPTYVFTTATALESLFQKLEIAPAKGKEGQILFAPISRLSPGLIAKRETTVEETERAKIRNRTCLDVAFFYVRVFQIYAALALTIMNTNPSRQTYIVKQKKQGVSPAPLMSGGADDRGLYRQRFDAVWSNIYYDEVKPSPFHVLENYFYFKRKPTGVFLESEVVSPYGNLSIEWDATKNELNAYYTEKTKKSVSPPEKLTVEIERRGSKEVSAAVRMNNNVVLVLTPSPQGWVMEEGRTEREKDKAFIDAIDEHYRDFIEDVREGKSVGQGRPPAARPGAPILGMPGSGKSPFYSFDDLKKLFETYHKGDPKMGQFPKAYCIARAMTLLNPIFESERLDKYTPFRSYICAKEYDFEAVQYMPRAGSPANGNIYFRSLVALSYESYEFNNQQVNLVQSAVSQKMLQETSLRMAKLYNIKGDEASRRGFLMSRTPFTQHTLCGGRDSQIFVQNDGFRKSLLTNAIMPMLALQEEHNQKALALLKELFIFEEGQLKFSKAIVKGGLSAINEIAHKAFTLLTNYYLLSEARYIRGMLVFENNNGKGFFSFA